MSNRFSRSTEVFYILATSILGAAIYSALLIILLASVRLVRSLFF